MAELKAALQKWDYDRPLEHVCGQRAPPTKSAGSRSRFRVSSDTETHQPRWWWFCPGHDTLAGSMAEHQKQKRKHSHSHSGQGFATRKSSRSARLFVYLVGAAAAPLPRTARNALSDCERADRSGPTGSMRAPLVLRLRGRPWRRPSTLQDNGRITPKVAHPSSSICDMYNAKE